jgi:hypothetical protein
MEASIEESKELLLDGFFAQLQLSYVPAYFDELLLPLMVPLHLSPLCFIHASLLSALSVKSKQEPFPNTCEQSFLPLAMGLTSDPVQEQEQR